MVTLSLCSQMLSTAVAAVSLHHGLKHSCTRALCSCGRGSQACIGATCQLTHLLPLTCSTTSPSPRFLDRQGWVSIMACHALSGSGAHTRTTSFLHSCAHKLTQSTCYALQVQHACICMSFRRLTIRGFFSCCWCLLSSSQRTSHAASPFFSCGISQL